MKMELPSLVLGMGVSTGMYALKTALGLQYYLEQENRRGRRRIVLVTFLIVYGLLCAALAAVVKRLAVGAHFQYVQTLMNNGRLMHFVMAAVMLLGGIILLKSRHRAQRQPRGWLVVVTPGPLGLTVICFTLAFLAAAFPEMWIRGVMILYAGFLALGFLTMLLRHRRGRRAGGSPEAALGAAMVAMSAYFILSVIIMPQFAGLEEAFRLAARSHQEPQAGCPARWAAIGILGLLFLGGYLHMRIRTRRWR